jgi:tellurite resistance protein TerC
VLALVTHWHWIAFTVFVLLALAVDLGVFHKCGRRVAFREALGWTALWALAAFVFAFLIAPRFIGGWKPGDTATFVTGYLVELSLSMDNVFVIALIFRYFAVPQEWQHRVLFWGILGALIMRGVLIAAGAALIHEFHWLLYVMGVFLVYSGAKMMRAGEDPAVDPEHNPAVKFVRKICPMTDQFDGERFVTYQAGRRLFTPLTLVLVMVETTDVVFALDSIPAIFGVTSNAFLIFTSNVFALLGLRSLYFVLASALGNFRLLKHGLSLVLVLIGLKMLTEKWLKAWLGESLTNVSLALVAGIIFTSVVASLILGWIERRRESGPSR